MKKIDVHVYYGKWYFPIPYKSVEDIKEIMRKRDIEKVIMMSSMSIIQDFREGNRELFEDIDGEESLYGYCFVNGNYVAESLEEMARYLPLPNCKGIKYQPEYSNKRPDDPDVRPIFETLSIDYAKPALIHSWPIGEHGNAEANSHPRFIAALAEELPGLNIVMGHMGGPQWRETIEIVKPYPNLYPDICASYTHFDKVKAAVDALGPYRVLFGSGMCEINPDTQIGVVVDSEISDEDKRIVFYEAAKHLFEL